MQVLTWHLQSVREVCVFITILISGEEQVYFRKINCKEDNNLRDAQKIFSDKNYLCSGRKMLEGNMKEGLDL